jgi:hypothetical protein
VSGIFNLMNTTNSQNTNTATFAKLRSGDWGVRVRSDHAPQPGEVVTVTKADRSTKQVTIEQVVWSGEGAHLCAIVAERAPSRPRSATVRAPRSGGRCRICRGPIQDCSYQRAMGGMCGACAYDEI